MILTAPGILTGNGKSFASFGEIIQGRKSDGTDFLVTIPIDLWSICNLKVMERHGPVAVHCELEKSKKVAEVILSKLDIATGYELHISFNRNIPVGKSLSSSTADMLSTLRALQEVFGFLLRPKAVSAIFREIEPHDGIMYKSSVIYNHRKGLLLEDLDYIPAFKIIVLDFGGNVDSVAYNKELSFSEDISQKYDTLYQECQKAYEKKDDHRIARCATKSLQINLETNNDPLRASVLKHYRDFGATGAINTHSGTCVGLIYPAETSDTVLETTAEKVGRHYGLSTFTTHSLKLIC